jgi:hypothetical protein
MYIIEQKRGIIPVTLAHLVSSALYLGQFWPYFVELFETGVESMPMLIPAEVASATEGA